MANFIEGSKATTINSTITELYPAIAFNNRKTFSTTKLFQDYIIDLAKNDKLWFSNTKKSFVDEDDSKKAKVLLMDTLDLRPTMREEKIKNAIGILNYFYEQDKIRKIDKIVWGYRAKPKGVPAGHAGDDFIFYKSKQKPQILGISLKAGKQKSNEPKLNSYVRTTLTKPYWKRAAPRAEETLKKELWSNAYSKLVGLNKRQININNWIDLSKKNQKPDDQVKEAVYRTFAKKKTLFEELYVKQNLVSRKLLCDIINRNYEATLMWIEDEFRLEKPADEVDVPLILVKAVGTKAEEQGDKLAKIFPKITDVKARLNNGSVQEWFIDVFSGQQKLTLIMTIRSDSEFRKEKQKGKLGAYTMLKLLYRGYR